ncbi:MAG: T9SS type A sorting domain-containing protein [Saprospiraceae bacterium]|nr:T9SS type A sorting domain-containing protein [Saprospiraceae bacterium]
MKKILFLLLGLFIQAAAQSQNCQSSIWPVDYDNGATTLSALDSSSSGVQEYLWSNGATTQTITVSTPDTYCVTVTYSDGCTSSDCYSLPDVCWVTTWWYWWGNSEVIINSYSGPSYLESTNLWSTGETGNAITVTSGGEYCITVTKENGCTATECVTIPPFPNNDDSCTAEIQGWFWPDSTVQLNALSNGQMVTYEWSTGAVTASIILDAPGNYCVTITDETGCQASDCYTYGDTSCYNYIYLNWQNSYTAELSTWSNHPAATYEWSTGATTPTILITQPGSYCVTTTNIYGCTSSNCLVVPQSGNYLNVYVHIPDSLNGIYAEVYLIEYDTAQGGMLTAIDTFYTSNGSTVAYFEDVPPGEYLVKAALMPGAPHYDEYLPTYNIQHLFWNDADPITITPLSFGTSISIHLIEGQNPGGPGFIGGLVSEGANFTASGDAARSEGDPMEGVQIILRKMDDTPVAAAKTQADGTFSFDGVAWGTYRVSLDLPGIEPLHQVVTINADQPSVTSTDFTVDGLGGASGTNALAQSQPLQVRPNPVREILTIDVPGNQGILTLFNSQGQMVSRTIENGSTAELDVHSLPEGIYFIHLLSGNRSFTTTISKQ